jgi:hypothetical protein
MDAILGADYPNLETADILCMLGDALQKASALKDAEVAYQRALQMFQIVEGSNGSFFKATANKLLSVQERLVNAVVDREHCALCGVSASKKCSRCDGQVVYCCREHQTVHWKKVHRKQCGKRASS